MCLFFVSPDVEAYNTEFDVGPLLFDPTEGNFEQPMFSLIIGK